MCKKIGVYGSSPRTGKTTTAVYLAESLATLGHKTLLIDASLNDSLKRKLAPQKDVVTIFEKVKLKGSLVSWSFLKAQNYSDYLENEIRKYDFEYVIVDLGKSQQEQYFSNLDICILPIEANFYGLNQIKSDLNYVKSYTSKTDIKILETFSNDKSQTSQQVSSYLKSNLSSLTFDAHISRSFYLGLNYFSIENLTKSAPNFGFVDYLKLANELVETYNG
jgi:cellulose biosynthesis protein BcsQ